MGAADSGRELSAGGDLRCFGRVGRIRLTQVQA
jgi:hypothetical protein